MRILIIYNRYQYKGGEDTYINLLIKLLKQKKHKVFLYIKDSKNIQNNLFSKIKISFNLIFGGKTKKELTKIIQKTKPDIAYFNNIYPLISPIAYRVCKKYGVKTVQRLSSYRFMCPKMSLFRNNKICLECANKSFFYPSIFYACYQNSYLASIIFASAFFIHKYYKIFNLINHYIFPSKFIQDIYKKYTWINDLNSIVVPSFYLSEKNINNVKKKNYFLFAGRFSEEKGILSLLEVFKKNKKLNLIAIGDGPLIKTVSKYGKYPNIKIIKFLKKEEVLNYMSRALYTIIPSKHFDVLPNVLIESFASKTGVIAPNYGVFPFLVKDGITGFLYSKDDYQNLKKILVNIKKTKAYSIGSNAQSVFINQYNQKDHYKTLITLFKKLLNEKNTS